MARLRLSAAEAARVCQVTPRQLIYWTRKGLVRPATDSDRDYDVLALEKVIRIRQELEKGHSLEKAAQLAQREMSAISADVDRLAGLGAAELEEELGPPVAGPRQRARGPGAQSARPRDPPHHGGPRRREDRARRTAGARARRDRAPRDRHA